MSAAETLIAGTTEIAAAIELDAAGAPPRRVKLLPIGEIKMRDGRGPYSLDDRAHADLVVAETRAWLGGVDFNFDYDHQTVFGAKPGVGGQAPASGWVKAANISSEDDGIWANDIEWTARGRAALQAREYRYVSPVFLARPDNRVARLKNAALVNSPAIDLPAIAAAFDGEHNVSQSETEEVSAMAVVTPELIKALRTTWVSFYAQGFQNAPSQFRDIAMETKSNGAKSVYGWLGQMPMMREWIGERRIIGLSAYGFEIENKDFESTVSVKRNDIMDDNVGIYGPMFKDLGWQAGMLPDKLIFSLVKAGFTSKCYDGQYFFDMDHPSFDEAGQEIFTSNMQDGAGPAWYLLDTKRAVRPFIYQERIPYQMIAKDEIHDDNVFYSKEYVYGCDGRSNAGYGMWQLAFGSKAPLTITNIEAAKLAMRSLRGDQGNLIAVEPDTILFPPALDHAARDTFKATLTNGESNVLAGTMKLVMSPWLG